MFLERLYWTAYLGWCVWGQARYPFRPLAAIRRDQARRVRWMAAHAYRTVPYYRETMNRLGLSPADFRSADDLTKLPIIERAQLNRDPEYFLSSACRPGQTLCTRSSGSSGSPIAVSFDMASLVEIMAQGERPRPVVDPLLRRRFGYRETYIASPWGNGVMMSRFCRERVWLPFGLPVQQQLLRVSDPPEKNAERMDEHKPNLVMTFGSYFEVLAPYWLDSGHRHHVPKVIAYGGDSMSEPVRRLITEDLKIQIVSAYQAVEASRIAFECEAHTGVHVNIDLHPVRTVDPSGQPLPLGEPGELVVSNLVNRATVLLNYRLGDLAALQPDPCPCGRTLPLLSYPQGRCDDRFELPSGEVISAFTVFGVFLKGDPIWQHEIIQETPSHFRVRLIVGQSCDRPGLARRIAEGFPKLLRQEVTVDVEFVDSLPRSPSGKHRAVRSLVPRAQRQPLGAVPSPQVPRA